MIWSALNSRTQTYEALIRFRSDPISVPGYIYLVQNIPFQKKSYKLHMDLCPLVH